MYKLCTVIGSSLVPRPLSYFVTVVAVPLVFAVRFVGSLYLSLLCFLLSC